MDREHTRQARRFAAYDDTGKAHTVYIYTQSLSAGAYGDRRTTIEGMTELQLADGSPVSRKQQGEYEVVATGMILRSADPNTP